MKKFLRKLLEYSAYTAVTIILFSVACIGRLIGYEMCKQGIVLSPVGSKIGCLKFVGMSCQLFCYRNT